MPFCFLVRAPCVQIWAMKPQSRQLLVLLVSLLSSASGSLCGGYPAFCASPITRRSYARALPAHGALYTAPVASLRERVKPRTNTEIQQAPVILVVEETEEETKLDGGWDLILFNDDFNSRHHVARTLVMVCKLTDDQAYDVMMHAHRFGTAVVGSYTKETAEQYCEGLLAAGIGCEVEKADSPE